MLLEHLRWWSDGQVYSINNITLDTLLASHYKARSIMRVSTPAKLRDERTIYPKAPPPWQLTGNNIDEERRL